MASGNNQEKVTEKNHGEFRSTPYAVSKFLSDNWLEQEFSEGQLLTIHPCYMLGQWDAKPSSGAILLALQMGKLTGYFPGTKNFVHAGDVARGIYDAVEKNITGRFILGGENYSIEEFLKRALGALKLDRELTVWDLQELEKNPTFKEFFLANAVDDSKARSEWGYKSDSKLDDILNETVTYFRNNKLLPRIKS